MGGPMHEAHNTDSLIAQDPLLDLHIPWGADGHGQDALSSHSAGRWQPRLTILVSLVVSLVLWGVIAALLF